MHILEFKEYRQVTTAFMEKHFKYKVTNMMLSLNAILNRQTNHSSRTVSISYTIASRNHNSMSREGMYQYYLISKEWYELLLGIEESKDMNE